MSKFHTTVSRRDFMKVLGLAGAGIGTAAATTPVFHDLDEVLSSTKAEWKRPWYVRERDFNNPSVEVDWNMFKRYDKRTFKGGDFTAFDQQTKDLIFNLYGTNDSYEAIKMWAKDGTKGMAHRDQALLAGIKVSREFEPGYSWVGHDIPPNKRMPTTNEYLDLPPYQGTPEDNTRMLRVAGRFYGSWAIGIAELDEKSRKIVWSNDGKRDIVFEDVEKAYEDGDKKVVPNKCKYVISMAVRHGELATKTSPGSLVSSAQAWGYHTAAMLSTRMQFFLRSLGYQGVGTSPAGSASWPAMTGIGELGRGAHVVTPEYGAMYRRFNFLFTDMPLAPTKPIDAGIHRFCHTCAKCAIQCPTGTIPEGEATWEGLGPWNNPGIKAFPLNYPTCAVYKSEWGPGYCGMCLANCPFSKLDDANAHTLVKAVVSTTSIFNGFITNMDDVFGYGQNWRAHEKGDNYVEEWWNTLGPEFGYLTHMG